MNGPPDWVLGEGLTTPCRKNINMLGNGIKNSDLDRSLSKTKEMENGHETWHFEFEKLV
jgi:hypothetical protein